MYCMFDLHWQLCPWKQRISRGHQWDYGREQVKIKKSHSGLSLRIRTLVYMLGHCLVQFTWSHSCLVLFVNYMYFYQLLVVRRICTLLVHACGGHPWQIMGEWIRYVTCLIASQSVLFVTVWFWQRKHRAQKISSASYFHCFRITHHRDCDATIDDDAAIPASSFPSFHGTPLPQRPLSTHQSAMMVHRLVHHQSAAASLFGRLNLHRPHHCCWWIHW